MSRTAAGNKGALFALLAMAVMAVLSHIVSPAFHLAGEAGICAPSPNLWPIPSGLSWLLNTTALIGIAVAATFANKKLVFVPGQDYVFPAIFLIATAASPFLTQSLNSSTLLCAANLGCIYLLLNSYGRYNATQEMFVVATVAALGATVQYAFLFFIPVYLLCAGTLQLLRPKELCAFGLGLIAPFWTLIGLGIVDIHDFAIPHLESLFSAKISRLDLVFSIIQLGLALLASMFLAVNNAIKLYNTSVRLMLFNRVILIVGFAAALFACIDFPNFTIYAETIFLLFAIQLANALEEADSRYGSYIFYGTSALFIILFLITLSA